MLAAGVWLGTTVPAVGVVAMVMAALARRRWPVVLVSLGVMAGALTGGLADAQDRAVLTSAVPGGSLEMRGRLSTDPSTPSRFGRQAFVIVPSALVASGLWVSWDGPPLLVRGDAPAAAVGDVVRVLGRVTAGPTRYRGRAVAGVVGSDQLELLSGPSDPFLRLGNLLRGRVQGTLLDRDPSPQRALLAGFLVGDVDALPERDHEALRRAGLAHFVAVSGSNVALFLGAWWLIGGPLAMAPRRRALFGLGGLAVFAAVTRWEPSVVRASVMAGLVLVGRLTGRPISPLTALGGAVVVSLIADTRLSGSVGFALSVLATAGIIVLAPVWSDREPRWLWTTLGATISAQLAVAPLLVWTFGSVPLLAPLGNLAAAPLVVVATIAAGVGVLFPIPGALELASFASGAVLVIAHTTSDLPHVGGVGLLVVLVVAVGALVFPSWRIPAGLVSATLLVAAVAPARPPAVPTVHFLDVGQGDATVFVGPGGEAILVDGGPDPLVLQRHLERLGVNRIDLLIVSHRHNDHVAGLDGLFQGRSVGLMWYSDQLGESDALDRIVEQAESSGVSARIPSVGDIASVGAFDVEVLAPLRRYASVNDMSVVVEVRTASATVLMAGDIEVHAQRDLGPRASTVMKVPHQGAATSDLEWLTASVPEIAVVSVGPNDFGHPSADVIEALTESGARVLRTDEAGTVSIELG